MFVPKNHSIKKPFACLFATTFLFSLISCNSEPEKESVVITQSVQQADTIQVPDTETVVKSDPDPVITTPEKPAPPKVKEVDAQFHKVLPYKNISFDVTA